MNLSFSFKYLACSRLRDRPTCSDLRAFVGRSGSRRLDRIPILRGLGFVVNCFGLWSSRVKLTDEDEREIISRRGEGRGKDEHERHGLRLF